MISEILLGTAIGDAFGVGVEMQSKESLIDISFDTWHNLRKGEYAKNYTPGDYSDDTEHTIGLVNALLSNKPFTEELLLYYWLTEYENDRKTKGYPRQGHGSIEKYYNKEISIEEVKHAQSLKLHPGNAPAMRAVPLGTLPESLLFRYAEINANATHPHEEARIASKLVAYVAHYLFTDGDHHSLLHNCYDKKEFSNIKRLLKQIDSFDTPENLHQSQYQVLCGPQPILVSDAKIVGLPSSSIHTAITCAYLLKHTSEPFLGLKRAIHIGGDVDSLASIVVGILAGRYGISNLPEFMISEVEGHDRLLQLGKKLEEFFK